MRNSEHTIVVVGNDVGQVIGLNAVHAQARIQHHVAAQRDGIAQGNVEIVIALLVADELLLAVIRRVRSPGAWSYDIALLKAIGCIQVVPAPVIIDAGVDVIAIELLVSPEEKVVFIENVIGRAVGQRIGVENRRPELIDAVRGQRAGKRLAYKKTARWSDRRKRIKKLNRLRRRSNQYKRLAEVSGPLRRRGHRHQVVIGAVEA